MGPTPQCSLCSRVQQWTYLKLTLAVSVALPLPCAAYHSPHTGEHSLNTLQALKSPSLLLENLTKAHTKQESKKRGLGSQGSLELAMT